MIPKKQKRPVPTGPALTRDELNELWLLIWSTLDRATRDGEASAIDEAQRLSIGFHRALWRREPYQQGVLRENDPECTALLAHYLLTRRELLEKRADSAPRLRVLDETSALLDRLLCVNSREWPEHFARLGIGLDQLCVFAPEVRYGVTIETLEEGPATPAEYERRAREASDAWNASWRAERERPRKRRQLEEGSP